MFRHSKFVTQSACKPSIVYDDVEVNTVDDNGVINVSFVQKPNEEVVHDLPNLSDYKLSSLLAAGVSLQQLPADVLDTRPSSDTIEDVVTSLEKSDKSKSDNN